MLNDFFFSFLFVHTHYFPRDSGDSNKESMTMKLGPFLQIQACMAEPGVNISAIVGKSDGGHSYASTNLATLWRRPWQGKLQLCNLCFWFSCFYATWSFKLMTFSLAWKDAKKL